MAAGAAPTLVVVQAQQRTPTLTGEDYAEIMQLAKARTTGVYTEGVYPLDDPRGPAKGDTRTRKAARSVVPKMPAQPSSYCAATV